MSTKIGIGYTLVICAVTLWQNKRLGVLEKGHCSDINSKGAENSHVTYLNIFPTTIQVCVEERSCKFRTALALLEYQPNIL